MQKRIDDVEQFFDFFIDLVEMNEKVEGIFITQYQKEIPALMSVVKLRLKPYIKEINHRNHEIVMIAGGSIQFYGTDSFSKHLSGRNFSSKTLIGVRLLGGTIPSKVNTDLDWLGRKAGICSAAMHYVRR